jgi:hypothetical protein
MRKLLILLLFISLACAMIVAQDEPTSEPTFWNSDMWNTYKIPIIIVAIVALIASVLVLLRRADNAHAEKVEAHAKTNGWKYSRQDDRDLDKLLDTVFPEQGFFVHNLREVQPKAPQVILFDSRLRDPVNAKKDISSTGCLVELARNETGRPMTEIVSIGVYGRIFSSNVVELRDEAFEKEFTVGCRDSITANRLVTPEVRRLLLEDVRRNSSETIRVVISSGHVLLLSGTTYLVEDGGRLNALVEMTKAIASAVESRSH